MSHIEDFVGVQYIALVLQQNLAKKPDLTPLELVNLIKGRGEETSELENPYELLDQRAVNEIREGIEEINAKLPWVAPEQKDNLLDEKKKLEQVLRSSRVKQPGADRSHRPASFATQSKNAHDAVRKAIRLAIGKMRLDKDLASLADHLNDNIKFHNTVSYVGSIAWTIQPGAFPRKKS